MKFRRILALTSALFISAMVTVSAAVPTVMFNGEKMDFQTDPYIKNDFTMVPFRAIFEKAGASVVWDDETRTVFAFKSEDENTTSIGMQIGLDRAFVNGEEKVLDIAPEITNDFTFVPLRFVMETLGAKVEWDHDAYTVIITTE